MTKTLNPAQTKKIKTTMMRKKWFMKFLMTALLYLVGRRMGGKTRKLLNLIAGRLLFRSM